MYDYITVATQRKPDEEIDKEVWVSPGHPSPADIPEAPASLRRAWARRQECAMQRPSGAQAEFSVLDFFDYLKAHRAELPNEDALWTHAKELDDSGDRRLLGFMLKRKDLQQLLAKAEKAQTASAAADREQQDRLTILRDAAHSRTCSCPTHGLARGRWKEAAEEVVALNGYTRQELQVAVLEALEEGRGK
jgi:hypothetical protein